MLHRASDLNSKASSHSLKTALAPHFKGFLPAATWVGAAALSVVLAAPRPTQPDVLPQPHIERSELRAIREQDLLLARPEPLSFEVRAVGEALRRFGENSVHNAAAAGSARVTLEERVQSALARRTEGELLRLRAVQALLFVRALDEFEGSGRESSELIELAGDFVSKARAAGWLAGTRLRLDRDERTVLFKARWSELTGLRARAAFELTLDEWRVYYRLLLRSAAPDADQAPMLARLRLIAALARRDPEYPADFARGVLLAQSGAWAAAAEAFRAHLAAHPHGPWSLRARNHLLFAFARTDEAP